MSREGPSTRPEPEGATWSLPSWPSSGDVARWFDQTAWWNTATLARTPQRALVGLLEAVAGRFTGRELTLQVGARAVRLSVSAVRVHARRLPSAVEDPLRWWAETSGMNDLVRWSRRAVGFDDSDDEPPIDAAELDATDVHIDGMLVGRITAHVDGMRLDPGSPLPELVTGVIELDVRTTRTRVVEWLRRELPAWDIEPRPDGLVALRMPRRRIRVLVRPTLHDRSVRIETIGVVVFGRALRIPRRLIRAREHELPALGPALQIVDARADGEDVALRLHHEGIHQALRLDALRAAIRDGATKITDAVFR